MPSNPQHDHLFNPDTNPMLRSLFDQIDTKNNAQNSNAKKKDDSIKQVGTWHFNDFDAWRYNVEDGKPTNSTSAGGSSSSSSTGSTSTMLIRIENEFLGEILRIGSDLLLHELNTMNIKVLTLNDTSLHLEIQHANVTKPAIDFVSAIKMRILAMPVIKYLQQLQSGREALRNPANMLPKCYNFRMRPNEQLWLVPSIANDKLTAVISVHIEDGSEQLVARIACQEFQEASRNRAIQCKFYGETVPDCLLQNNFKFYKPLDACRIDNFNVRFQSIFGTAQSMNVLKETHEKNQAKLIEKQNKFMATLPDGVSANDASLPVFPNVGFLQFTIHANELTSPKRMLEVSSYVVGVKSFMAHHITASKSCLFAKMRTLCQDLQQGVVLG